MSMESYELAQREEKEEEKKTIMEELADIEELNKELQALLESNGGIEFLCTEKNNQR